MSQAFRAVVQAGDPPKLTPSERMRLLAQKKNIPIQIKVRQPKRKSPPPASPTKKSKTIASLPLQRNRTNDDIIGESDEPDKDVVPPSLKETDVDNLPTLPKATLDVEGLFFDCHNEEHSATTDQQRDKQDAASDSGNEGARPSHPDYQPTTAEPGTATPRPQPAKPAVAKAKASLKRLPPSQKPQVVLKSPAQELPQKAPPSRKNPRPTLAPPAASEAPAAAPARTAPVQALLALKSNSPAGTKTANTKPPTNPNPPKQKPSWVQLYAKLVGLHQIYGKETFAKLAHSGPNTDAMIHQVVIWLAEQRRLYQANQLGESQMVALNRLGMDWNDNLVPLPTYDWEWHCDLVEKYYKQHGTLQTMDKNSNLFHWLVEQRRQYYALEKEQSNELDQERLTKLEAMGLATLTLAEPAREPAQKKSPPKRKSQRARSIPRYSTWNRGYLELKTFHENFGNIAVPASDSKLRQWLDEQRQLYQQVKKTKGGMTDERVRLLVELGIDKQVDESLISRTRDWNWMYQSLLKYKTQSGQPDGRMVVVPDDRTDLYAWVQEQREYYKAYKGNDSQYTWGTVLTEEQIECLDKVGFGADKEDDVAPTDDERDGAIAPDFGVLFGQLVAYRRTHGHINFPENGTSQLALFVEREQRHYQIYKDMGSYPTSFMNLRRAKLLESVGVIEEEPKESTKDDSPGVETRRSKRARKGRL